MANVQVIAHRGASKAEKENTLAAFRRAGEMGSHAVELDVRRTADGRMAIHHDAALADGRLIFQTHSSELPADLPNLDEALDACAGMWVNIEIKNYPQDPDFDETDMLAATVARYLEKRGDDHRWLISCFHRGTVDAMRTLRPEVRTAWLTMGVRPEEYEKTARSLANSGHTALHPYFGHVTKECIDVFHSHGVQVNSWTVDDPAKMAELVQWGIDGLCTNVPDIALAVLSGRA
jgi:glycerophosphoryl diester phosphodiesterase